MGVDYYHVLRLAAGDVLSAAILGSPANTLRLQVENAAGVVLVQSAAGPTNFDQEIAHYTVPTSGDYYLRVIGNLNQTYTLLAGRNTELSAEPNSVPALCRI